MPAAPSGIAAPAVAVVFRREPVKTLVGSVVVFGVLIIVTFVNQWKDDNPESFCDRCRGDSG